MICTCHNCRRYYWKYRRPWETPGFCSVFCREMWIDERSGRRESDPGIPCAILELIRSHNRTIHHGEEWAECAECERLEALHAAAIAYHMPALPSQLAPVSIAAEPRRQTIKLPAELKKKGKSHVA